MNDLKGIIEDCNMSDLVSDKVIKKVIEIIGQEEWQDLHDENNDVCTTMGELIITLEGIADLEKENAELKESVLQFQKDSYCGVCHFKTKTQLKQAKEIIREFVEWANWQGSNCPNFKSIQDKAETFLNSEVEK